MYMRIATPTTLTLENHSQFTITKIRIFVVDESCEINSLLPNTRDFCRFNPQEEGFYRVIWESDSQHFSSEFGYYSERGTFGDLAAFKNRDKLVHLDEHYFW